MGNAYENLKVHPDIRTMIRKIGAHTNENMLQVLRRLLKVEIEAQKITDHATSNP